MGIRNHSLQPLAAALAGLALTAAPAGATLIAQFDFDGDLTNSVGGSSITAAHVDGSAGDISFATNAGKLTLTNPTGTASNIDYVSTNYTPGDNGTIAFRHEAEALYNYNSLLTNSINQDDWEMWIYGDGRARARVEADGPVTTTAVAGVEAHYAFTWERSGTSVTVNLYKDGSLEETNTGTWLNPGAMSFGGGNNNHGGRGVFDDFRIYDTALSAAEVAAIAGAGPDLTDPELASVDPLSPADDSTFVAVDTNFVATFSENIALTATGTITVTDGSETRVVNLDGSADDGNASVLDNVLTITLDTDLTNLNSSYDVLLSNDAIVDTAAAQNPFAGTVAGDWNFTTSDGSGGGSVIVFNGIAGGNNAAIPSAFGSNLSSDIGGATVSNGGTPNIALAWAGPNGGWDLHGGGGAGFWAALDSDTATTPSVGQMESPTAASPNTVTFTVDAGWALQLNSVDIGMATDKTATYYWDVTISELGGAEVFSTLTAAMDGDGGSGVQALTVALNFTGDPGTDYVLAFNDVDGSGNDTISTNGGAIDSLSFGQVIPGPDETPPTIASGNPFNPADDSTNVSISTNLAVTFNESVVFGTGSITIRKSVGNGLVESFDVETSSKLLLSDRTVTIDPTLDLSAATGYYVQIDPTAIDDTSGNDFAGIADTSTWNFTTDATPPSIGTVDNPANGASDVSTDSELALTFSEAVQVGSGNIVIRRISDNSVVAVIDVGGANVTVDGSQVTIVPPSALPELTGLYVEVDAGAFLDLSGNSFAGLSGSETWSFTTAAAFRLFMSPNGPDFDFSWPSKVGKAYDLLSSTDLATPPAEWDVYDPDGPGGTPPYGDIPSDGLLTTLSAVPASDPRRFFVVSEKDAPPVVLVEAHRGYSQVAPENTVASIEAATGFADLSEMDVRVTSDGELVLMHDGNVDRTTNGSGSVGSMTLAQIQLLDAGSWFSAAFAGEPVPTMAEAINACLTNNIEPLVERKAGAASVYHAEFVSLGLDPSEFRVISFNSGFLADLNALNPDYRLGLLSGGTITQSVIDNLKSLGIDFLDWGHGSVDQAAVDLVHANGMELHAYTVNGASQMQQLIDFGVDGITTDNPALLRSLLP